MKSDIFERLAQHLDNLPGGFPSTESGVELRILKKLFTPDDAELALHLTLIPEESRVVARRAGISRDEADRRLEEMAKKGLIYCLYPENRLPQYQAGQFVAGIWEWQVNKLSPEFVKDMEEYWPTLQNPDTWKKTPQMRTIPIDKSIEVQKEVMPYEKAKELVREQDRIAVAPCICRQEQKIKGEGCNNPEETCLSFGQVADYYVQNGLGRSITQQEALNILELADKYGLVLQPSNSKEAGFLCCCCGCCCGIFRNILQHPKPASIVSTPFVVRTNPETCTGCETCIDRCHTGALEIMDGIAVMDADRCIGCGLCVSTCPSDSLTLVRKPKSEQPKVPEDFTKTLLKLGMNRGKLKPGNLIKMAVKSKMDRLLTPK